MVYFSAKAIEGGTPLSDEEIEQLAHSQLKELQSQFARRPEGRKTADLISQRLGEELRLVQRMLEIVEDELRKKGETDAAGYLRQSEDTLEDIAEVVESAEPCEAIETVDADLKRRLLRASLDGNDRPCAKQRPSIRRKD